MDNINDTFSSRILLLFSTTSEYLWRADIDLISAKRETFLEVLVSCRRGVGAKERDEISMAGRA